ncbi:hypothetical protein AB8B12_01195 [Streptomyces sp. PGLac3x]
MTNHHAIRVLAGTGAAFALVLGATGAASAAPSDPIKTRGGYAQWNADPSGSIPGDSIRACDNTADGWGIEAWLDINRDGTIDRVATTRGHNAPYCSSWKSGDIPEGTPVTIYAVTVNGGITLEKGGALWSKA